MFPTIKFNIERWKYNPTFELYVSNMGHIRNKSKADIAPKIMQNGYVVVWVHGSINGYMLLHRVVMLTWKPTPEAEKLTVDHIDHNKRNNALSNLEWVTLAENLNRAKQDYVGSCCPLGCEFIQNIDVCSANPNTKRAKHATAMKEYKDKMKNVIFMVEPDGEKNLHRPTFTFTPNEEGFKFAEDMMKGFIFDINIFKRKVNAMLNGTNRLGHASYCGLIISVLKEGEYEVMD